MHDTRATMEPVLFTPQHLMPYLEELRALEPLFHAAHASATPRLFEELVAPEFWEIGASGRNYSRAFALHVLTDRPTQPTEQEWVTTDFHLSALGENTYLLTYTLTQPGRSTRRATIWRKHQAGWQAVFHQGTVMQA